VQALGRPQAVFGHSLVIFTRGHGRLGFLESDFILKMRSLR
jgi:hypothetical protein